MSHAMPTGWYLTLNAVGATHVFMPKFDGKEAFAAIERFRVNGVLHAAHPTEASAPSARGDDVKV